MMASTTREIGSDNIPVSAVGFGLMGISAYYGNIDPDEERLKVLDVAFERGCTFWDTANIYGDSEELIGKWLKKTGKRDQIFLATKFGVNPDNRTEVNGSPEHMQESIDRSLQRLGVTQVDLYYLHRPDPKVPIELTVAAMAQLVEQKKVKYLGLSECSADTLRRASAIYPITAVQLEYSPLELTLEINGVLKTARELGIKIIAYSPLGRGLLTGRFKSPDDFGEGDLLRNVTKFSKENFPKILRLVEELNRIGNEYNATAGQIALAWVLAQGQDIIAIPGTKKIKYLEENLAAACITLSAETIQEVRVLAEEAQSLEGDRYPSVLMRTLYGNTPTYRHRRCIWI